MILFISGGEIVIVVLIVLMLFGAKKIPELAKELAKGTRMLRDVKEKVKNEILESKDGIIQEFETNRKEMLKGVEKEVKDIETHIEDKPILEPSTPSPTHKVEEPTIPKT